MVRIAIAAILALAALTPSRVALADNMTTAQAKCVRETNRAYRKLAAVYGAEYTRCVKSVAKGGSYDTCVAGIEQNVKVQKAQARVREVEETRCADLPPFAYSSAATVIQAAADQERTLITKSLGADAGTAITPSSASCQAAVLKAVQKCRDTTVGGYNECSYQEIQILDDTPLDRDLAGTCLRQGIIAESRLRGSPRIFWKDCRVAIGKAMQGACGITTEAAFDASFPGCANGPSGGQLCLKSMVTCTACRSLVVADALDISGLPGDPCERADNDNVDDSCAP